MSEENVMPVDMDKAFVFIDLETMGFAIDAPIVEVGMVLTDHELKIYDEWSRVVPYSYLEWIDRCDGAALKMHQDSGLIEESIVAHERSESDLHRSLVSIFSIEGRLARLDAFTLDRLVSWGLRPKTATFVGNSLHMDRTWMRRQMPRTDEYAHYRQVDVSSIRVLAERWHAPELSKWWRTQDSPGTHHRALDDAKFAVQELKLYREHVFAGATIAQHIAPPQPTPEESQ